jgi:hypothetical protein
MGMGIRHRVTQQDAVTALVAVGLVLRVWQYAANPPLRGASMQRCALLDWSVRLRGATPTVRA